MSPYFIKARSSSCLSLSLILLATDTRECLPVEEPLVRLSLLFTNTSEISETAYGVMLDSALLLFIDSVEHFLHIPLPEDDVCRREL